MIKEELEDFAVDDGFETCRGAEDTLYQSHLCVICLDPNLKSSWSPWWTEFDSEPYLKKNLSIIFLLRRLLQISENECASLFCNTSGVDPGDWCDVCDKCAKLAQDAVHLYQKIFEIERKLESIRRELRRKMEESFKINKIYRGGDQDENLVDAHHLIRDSFKRAHLITVLSPVAIAGHDLNPEVESDSNDGILHDEDFDNNLVTAASPHSPDNQIPASEDSSSDKDFDNDPETAASSDNPTSSEDSPSSDEETSSRSRKKRKSRLPTKTSKAKKLRDLRTKSLATKKIYECDLCSRKYVTLKQFEHHQVAHQEFPFACQVCKFPCKTEALLDYHKRNNHKSVWQKCDRCDYVNTSKHREHYDTHMKRHKMLDNMKVIKVKKGEETFQCKLCSEKGNKNSIFAHMRKTHAEEIGIEVFPCEKCDKILSTSNLLRCHIRTMHDKEYLYKCEDCGSGFINKTVFTKHIEMHKVRIICDLCGQSFTNKMELQRHTKQDHIDEIEPVKELKDFDHGNPESNWDKSQNENFAANAADDDVGTDTEDLMDNPPSPEVEDSSSSEEETESQQNKSDKSFKCNICPCKYVTKKQFFRHKRDHNLYQATTCKLCNYPCKTEAILKRHHQGTHLRCEICQFRCTSNEGLAAHTEKHKIKDNIETLEGENNFRCKLCPEKVGNKVNIFDHIKANHTNELELKVTLLASRKIHKCDICSRKYSSASHLHRHRRIHREFKISCELCNFPCKTEALLDTHKRIYHKLELPSIGHQCDRCNYTNTKKEQFETHMKHHKMLDNMEAIQGTKNSFQCKLCPAIGVKIALFTHMRSSHAEEIGLEVYPCERCGKLFSTTSKLRDHIKTIHDNDFRYRCHFCGRGFMVKGQFESHVEIHNNDGKCTIVCEVCGQSFTDKSGLQRHTKRHHKDNEEEKSGNLKCKHCTVKVLHSLALKLHIKQAHPELYKYSCDICDASYVGLAGLELHKKAKHSEEKSVCQYCQAEVSCDEYLKAHYKNCKKYPTPGKYDFPRKNRKVETKKKGKKGRPKKSKCDNS